MKIPEKFSRFFEIWTMKIFEKSGLVEFVPDFKPGEVSTRTTVFTDEGKKRGWNFLYAKGPAGYINNFYMDVNGKRYLCEGLPRVEWLLTKNAALIDDKAFVKEKLLAHSLPVPEGRAFWFWQKRKVLNYGAGLGFPLVVKPRSGSMSQHVTVNVKDAKSLEEAIVRACRYSPAFIVERFVPNTRVFRATVIDGEKVACVERVPAHVTGDGVRSVRELLDLKNKDPRRGRPGQKDTTHLKIVVDGLTDKLLSAQGYDWDSVPEKDKRVYLQEKVILDLGADLFERTSEVHSDNLELFRAVAGLFETKLVGIDVLAEDISESWRKQNFAIIELNSLPYVDMHHFPIEGEPVNVGGFICDMVEKYYG